MTHEKKKILISGGRGSLAQEIERQNVDFDLVLLSKEEMDITDINQVQSQIMIHKPDVILHCAAMTHPMESHNENPKKSIKNNILGTANIAMVCAEKKIKMVYISTDWVYPNKMKNTEKDGLLPATNYGWAKLGGECSVHMLPNYLVLRCSFTTRPYKFDKAFTDVYKSCLYVDEIAPLIIELITKESTGIYNVCGKIRTAYSFAKESNTNVGRISKEEVCSWIPDKCTMDNDKLMRELI